VSFVLFVDPSSPPSQAVGARGRLRRAFAPTLAVVLGALSLAYAAKGFTYLVLKPDVPSDFQLRWAETRYLLAGRNPNDAFFASPKAAAMRRPLWSPRDESPLPEIGAPLMSCYPPWGLFSGVLLYWPPDIQVARWYFGAANVGALAVLLMFGYRLGRHYGMWHGAALGLSCTALSSISTALGVGQYGVVITAFLVLCYWALARKLEQGQDAAAAGWWLGLAAAKPILSGPFGLAFLFPLRMRALVTLFVFFAVANGVVWLATGANPVEMVLQMLRGGQEFVNDSYGPMNALIGLGVPPVVAQIGTALGCVAAAAVLIAMWARAPLLVTFAIAAVAARLWSYHHLYDNVVLLFLLAALGELACRRANASTVAAFLVVGISLWAPGKLCDLLPFQIFQTVAWVGGLAFLLACTPRHASANPAPEGAAA
jgi:hypothetical protein